MSKTRLGFTTLVAACCLALASFGVAQQDSSQSQSQASQQQGQMSSQSSNSQVPAATQRFLDKMAKDSQGEVQIAQMVQQKSSNAQVKQFAQQLEQDHTQMNQQMQSTFSQLGMSMPSQSMTAEQQQLKTKLESMSGAQFDKTFINAQVKDHEKDVREIQQHMQSASNDQVKELLQGALPKMQQHLQTAKQLQSQLGSGQSSGK